jgi:hypothetical protein
MNLEDEARKFSAAARKRQRDNKRQGIKSRWIKVADAIAIPSLVAEGLLAEKDIHDDEAIDAALAEHLTRSFSRGRILRDTSSGQLLSPRKEMDRYCRQQPQPWVAEVMAEYERARKEHARRCHEHRDRCKKETARRVQKGGEAAEAWFSPGTGARSKSGDAKGRNPGLLTAQVVDARGRRLGSYVSKPLPGSSGKRIKQLKVGKLNKLEKDLGVTEDKSSDPHFVQLDAGEAERKLDRNEAEDEGIGIATPPSPNLDKQ